VNGEEGYGRLLVNVSNLSLGYDAPLFSDITFQIREGEVAEIRGRNGAGKTTLVKTLLATINKANLPATVYDGIVETDKKIRVGVYEQEAPEEIFKKTLAQAIEHIYMSRNLKINETKIRQLMSDYLFTQGDANIPVSQLSGGQKARLQLITMLADSPQLLVLDEPTNHLDVDAKDELKRALQEYKGSILMVCHEPEFYDGLATQVWDLSQWTTKI
jgi:ATPase subunit of ABC transporter with duplicated ATPase domains